MLFAGSGFTPGSAAGILLALVFLYLLFRPNKPHSVPHIRSTEARAA
jgi:hypothetical protein